MYKALNIDLPCHTEYTVCNHGTAVWYPNGARLTIYPNDDGEDSVTLGGKSYTVNHLISISTK